MQLEVREGDIAAVEADAIANAANDRLWMGAGVADALKRAGGVEIEEEAVAPLQALIAEAIACKREIKPAVAVARREFLRRHINGKGLFHPLLDLVRSQRAFR